MRKKGNISPNHGGCWYCHNQDDELVFCKEFDTYIHRDCIRDKVSEAIQDPELEIIFRELWV